MWGGWGSNPRLADYEKPGPVHRVRYLHGYHGSRAANGRDCAVCTDGSVHEPVHAFHGEHRTPATERYR